MEDAKGHLLARAGRALPQNLRGRQGLALIDPPASPLPPPENPGVAPLEVPDRGDDLTPCPLRARHGSMCPDLAQLVRICAGGACMGR